MPTDSKRQLILKSLNQLRDTLPSTPTTLSAKEVEKIERDSKLAELRKKNLENDELEDIISLRKMYAKKIMSFAIAWSVFTLLLIFLNGFSIWSFKLDSKVLMTIITTALGNVFALAIVVAKSIFPEKR